MQACASRGTASRMMSTAECRRSLLLTMLTWAGLAGNYSDVNGSSFCRECPSNSTSAAERASCFCNAGYWNVNNCSNMTHNTTAECTSRHVGKLITLGRGPCMACDPGAQH